MLCALSRRNLLRGVNFNAMRRGVWGGGRLLPLLPTKHTQNIPMSKNRVGVGGGGGVPTA